MKATRICAALLVILLTLGMSGCLISPKEYAVSGVVTDKDTGLGVEGVTITFSGGFTPVTTDAEGRWTKTGVRGIVTVIPVATTNKFVPVVTGCDRQCFRRGLRGTAPGGDGILVLSSGRR